MSIYKDLTVTEIYKGGVKELLKEKKPEEWTDYDCALAYMYNLNIPEGKMPKELLIQALSNANRYTALALLQRPEVDEYREAAVNLFIDSYFSNWVRQCINDNSFKPGKDPILEAKMSLQCTIYMWIYNREIPITWNNIAKVLILCNDMSKKEVLKIINCMSRNNNESIPENIMNIVNMMSEE